jgi:aspartokinase
MNITRLAQHYIREHPSVADCLDRGLVNYSALAREICQQLNVSAFDAVLIACRRYRARHKVPTAHEKNITVLMKSAKVHVRNRIAVVIVEREKMLEKAFGIQKLVRKERGDFNLIEGEEVFVIITNVEYVPVIKETFGQKVLKVSRDLVQIAMIFNEKIETTSGVVAHIYRLFSENDINIREEMSCWTDVMVVIDEKDLPKAMQVLSAS